MNDDLHSWSSRSLEAKRKMPQDWWYEDRDENRSQAKTAARETVRGEDTVVLGDGDADGLGGVAVIREALDADVAFVSCGPHGSNLYLSDALWVCVDELSAGATVIIQDIAVDEQWKIRALPQVAETAGSVLWFDHHSWDDEVAAFVDTHTDRFVLDEGTDDPDNGVFEARSAAMMLRDYYASHGHSFTSEFNTAVDVTGEYDLWRLRDDRCYDLHDLTAVVEDERYISLIRAHGADVLAHSDVTAAVADHREEQTQLHDRAVTTASHHTVGEWTVATVYGNCPANDVAETLREQGADAVVFVRPHGGVSLRGSDAFTQCHRIADAFGGGGHEKAAGAGLYDQFDSHLDYAVHWTSQGEQVTRRLLDEFQTLATRSDTSGTETDTDPVPQPE